MHQPPALVGTIIPAWYDSEGRFVVAANEAEALDKFYEQYGGNNIQLKRDEDCLDTWFLPGSGPLKYSRIQQPGNADIRYYYPTNTLVTARRSSSSGVARMIIAGYEYMGQSPSAMYTLQVSYGIRSAAR